MGRALRGPLTSWTALTLESVGEGKSRRRTTTLFRNKGDRTFEDVSFKAGILKTPGIYGLGVLVSDFDNDRWPDIYGWQGSGRHGRGCLWTSMATGVWIFATVPLDPSDGHLDLRKDAWVTVTQVNRVLAVKEGSTD